jgi:small redox-active disulfide protein 2
MEMKTIKVYGPGCARCKQTEQIVRLAVEQSSVEATIQHIHEYQQMAADGIISTPAVSVDGVVKVAGRVPKLEEMKGWLRE